MSTPADFRGLASKLMARPESTPSDGGWPYEQEMRRRPGRIFLRRRSAEPFAHSGQQAPRRESAAQPILFPAIFAASDLKEVRTFSNQFRLVPSDLNGWQAFESSQSKSAAFSYHVVPASLQTLGITTFTIGDKFHPGSETSSR
jgi:hypothetical protein